MSFDLIPIPSSSRKDFEYHIKHPDKNIKKNVISTNDNNELCIINYTIATWALKFLIRYKFLDNFLSKFSASCIKMIRDHKEDTLLKLYSYKIQLAEPRTNLLISVNDINRLNSLSFISLQMLRLEDNEIANAELHTSDY